MSPSIERVADAARVALAVDALCVGTPYPVLAHLSREPEPDDGPGAFGLYCTPLVELTTVDDATVVLEQVRPPGIWAVAALCAPTTIRTRHDRACRHAAWFVHVVTHDGGRASRLSVPADHALSGPVTVTDARLDRCLTRFVCDPSEARTGTTSRFTGDSRCGPTSIGVWDPRPPAPL